MGSEAPTYIVDFEPPEKEAARLNLQHRLLVEISGSLLPPSIPLDGVKAIADFATGTGIFLTQLAELVPLETQLHGYDINVALFPPASTLPPNIAFTKLSVIEDVPESLHGKYDIVHCRGLCMVLKANEWTYVVQNLKKMVKPGGYLIMTDANLGTAKAYPPTDYATQAAEILSTMCVVRGGDAHQMDKLPKIFEEEGFTLVHSPNDFIAGPDFKESVRAPWSENYVSGITSIIHFLVMNKIPNKWFTEDTYKEFIDKFVGETDGGKKVHILFDLITVAGKLKE